MRYFGIGIRKESEIREGTLSHLGLKPDSEITVVNEENLRHHPAGFRKVKAPGLKSRELTSSKAQMSLPYKSSENSLLQWSF